MMVAKHLGATIVLPDIRGSKPGDEMLVVFAFFVNVLVSFL